LYNDVQILGDSRAVSEDLEVCVDGNVGVGIPKIRTVMSNRI